MPRRRRKKLKKRTPTQKREDIRLARKLGDRRYTYYCRKKVRATIVSRQTLYKATKKAKRAMVLGQSPKSKRHSIYFNLFKIYAQNGENQRHFWDYITYEKINNAYPDDDD